MNANRGSVNLGSLFSDKQITSAFKTVDPYADDFYEKLVKQLTENGEARLNEALNLFPTLEPTEALRLVYAFFKSEPEKQAIVLTIAKRGSLASAAQAIEATFPPQSPLATYLLHGGPFVLPKMCANLPLAMRVRYRFAQWAKGTSPYVLRLFLDFPPFKDLESSMLREELTELVSYLKTHQVQVTKVEPEATILLSQHLLSAFIDTDIANSLFVGTGPRQRLETLKACGLGNILEGVDQAWQKLTFGPLNQRFERVPDALIERPLQPELQKALRRRLLTQVNHSFNKRFKRKKGGSWQFMDDRVATALNNLLGFSVPQWAIGDYKAFVNVLIEQNLLQSLSKAQLQALMDKVGMPEKTAIATHELSQKLAQGCPDAYEPMLLTTLWKVAPNKAIFKIVGWPKITLESLSEVFESDLPENKLDWLNAYLRTVDQATSDAIKVLLIEKRPKSALRLIDPTDECWRQVPLKTCIQLDLWSVVAHADTQRVLEEVPRRFLVDRILARCGRKAYSPKPYDRLNDETLHEAYCALTQSAQCRRHFVTSLLEREWCRDHQGRSYQILGGRYCSYKVLAIELLRCSTFLGDRSFRQDVVELALKEASSLPERQTLLRLIQKDAVEPQLPEVWVKAVLSWPKKVLKTLLPNMRQTLLDAYVAREGLKALDACYKASPKGLSSRLFFLLRVNRLKTGGAWPENRILRSDAQGFDEVIEKASNLLCISEPRLWDATLECMPEKAQAVLQYATKHAKAVMSPGLARWIDVVLQRYALKPEARLDALLADQTTTDVKFWPHQGPDGTKGDVYAYLRVHHSLKALSAVWSERQTLPDSVLPTMVAHWPNDAAWFELFLALGKSHTSLLRQVMGMMDFKAPFGSRFDAHYRHSTIPKKNGGVRDIYAPARALKALQSLINVKLLQPLGAHDAAFGFVPGRNISGNAERHVGQPVVATADIHACFPSVSRGLVVHALKRDLGDRFSYGAILKLADICLSKGVLPTGAPTSPTLLNRVLLRTDELLTDAASKKGCTYTRYADDITFSGDDGAVSLLGVAKGVLKPIGLTLDPKKTNVFRRGRRQCCTGLVVNDRVSVNRETCRRLRASVHALELGRPLLWDGNPETVAQLRGRLAFLASVKKEEGARLMARLDAALMQKTVTC